MVTRSLSHVQHFGRRRSCCAAKEQESGRLVCADGYAPEERFVGVYIAHPTHDRLIEHHRFDGCRTPVDGIVEIRGRDREGLGTEPVTRASAARPIRWPNMRVSSNIKTESSSVRYGARIRCAPGVEQQLSGHAEVDDKVAAVEHDDDELPRRSTRSMRRPIRNSGGVLPAWRNGCFA